MCATHALIIHCLNQRDKDLTHASCLARRAVALLLMIVLFMRKESTIRKGHPGMEANVFDELQNQDGFKKTRSTPPGAAYFPERAT